MDMFSKDIDGTMAERPRYPKDIDNHKHSQEIGASRNQIAQSIGMLMM